MKLKQLPREYQKAIPVLNKLEQAGFEAYFVGEASEISCWINPSMM